MIRNEPLQQLIYQLKVRLGLVKPDPPDQIEELRKDPQKPPEYLQRFDLGPLEAPEQVIGREKDLESLQRAYKNWKQVHRPLLLSGEPGCGLSSFLAAALPDLEHARFLPDDYRICNITELLKYLSQAFGLADITSADQLVEQILAGEECVVIFENLERIFLRTLGGFDLLVLLRSIVNLTSERVFWILTISNYPLYFLDRVRGIRSFFDPNFRYQLSLLEETAIEEIISERNTGYELFFLKAGDIPPALERLLSKADSDEKQQLLRNDFFRQLHAFAGGNVSRALLFWTESVQGVREQKIYLKAFSPDKIKDIQAPDGKITLQNLFALEAIFQHTSLSAEDLAVVLRNSEQSSRLMIAQLQQHHWIYPRRLRKERQEYQINLLYQSELQKLLVDQFNRDIKMN